LEILCDQPSAAMTALDGLPEIKEVALFGQGLHAVAADAAVAERAIRAALARDGRRVDRVERITPTLEDVFVSLIEARDRAGRAQPEVSQ
jgi:ABC-2 type transport system ATP-binding protein